MTGRERELATIGRKPTDRIALDAICVENVPQIAEFLALSEMQVLDRLGLDGRIIAAGYTGQRDEGALARGVDEWGTSALNDYGRNYAYPLAGFETEAQIAGYSWPNPADYDFEAAATWARQYGATYALRGPYWVPVFSRACSLVGMEDFLVLMMQEPLLAEALLERISEFTYQYCERLLDACGEALPILCLGDDFATQRGLMLNPEIWRKLLKPHYARLFDLGKRKGRVVWFHSCGDVTSVLGDLIDIGADVWETVQLHALPYGPGELKRRFGADITFFGGINTQRLPFITPVEVREEVFRTLDVMAEGGGYICGPDHHIKYDVPPENAVTLFDAALEWSGA